MQFCASKNVDQFASENPAQFDWILQLPKKSAIYLVIKWEDHSPQQYFNYDTT